ncbi:CinA family nicotinamide mononucleotide deamidase-related protein [Flavobacterium luminosum]|uniref:CinA-like protein n=1 Tax=Flavobacterium luminosum TaxID=2949086 RepID=A0ABT0TLM6_9FLAO|nr:CinA family nicotinamide mononucleotide deamidase-related protein [Flavobacterium sp. HXWNR70]MCL9808400.1 CinA family nicotinamide mononucleotide deamidase-related protein [Flavobacterium sp. HXWNR70]
MKAAIVTIGDEILIGQIIDTNSGYLAKALDKIGIGVHEMLSISDDKHHILNTLSSLQNKVEVVIITGGLGPTKDDITKKTLCEYTNDTLVSNDEVLTHVTQLIETNFKRPISALNREQALVPSRCEVLFNKVGTAPGMWMEKENTVFISLPGVPYEMKYIIENEVIPRLIAKYKRPYIIHKTLLTYGVGESLLAERIEEWEDNLPEFIKLAYLPSPGRVRLRLSARGTSEEVLQQALTEQIALLKPQIEDCLVGLDEGEPLEVMLGKLLTSHQLTIATAESCTGGKIATVLTAVPGASAYFKGSIVSYATEIKETVLGIPSETIQQHSVVSAEVAREMAQKVQQLLKADFVIATTGNAGPSKGEAEAEVGTVFIGIATPKKVYAEEFNFGQPREKVVDRAVNKGLELIYKEILKNYEK